MTTLDNSAGVIITTTLTTYSNNLRPNQHPWALEGRYCWVDADSLCSPPIAKWSPKSIYASIWYLFAYLSIRLPIVRPIHPTIILRSSNIPRIILRKYYDIYCVVSMCILRTTTYTTRNGFWRFVLTQITKSANRQICQNTNQLNKLGWFDSSWGILWMVSHSQ